MMNRFRPLSLALAMFICGASFGESQIIARLKKGWSGPPIATAAKVIYRDGTPGAPFVLFGVPSGMTPAAAQAALLADSRVLWAEDNVETSEPEHQGGHGGSIAAIGNRSDLVTRNTAALAQVHWNASYAASAGVVSRIAILDTGLSRKQPALWAKVDAWWDATKKNADDVATGLDSNGNGVKDEGTGHGTMLAGICDMVAPQVRFVIAKVADSDGVATAWTLTKGLAFAATHGAKVANVSLGSPTQIVALRDVTDWCDEVGLLYVAAIGNGASGSAWFPSIYSKVLCVSGLNADNTKASFSNWDGGCDCAAPAVGIVSQYRDGQLGVWSGTSFAAPFLSATAADYLRHRPATDSKTLTRLLSSGDSIDNKNPAYKKKLGTLLNYAKLIGPVAPATP